MLYVYNYSIDGLSIQPHMFALKKLWEAFLNLLLPQSGMARELMHLDTSEIVHRARRTQRQLPNTESLFDYRDPLMKQLVWEIKFRGNLQLTKLAATLLYDHLIADLSDTHLFSNTDQPIIVPVPLSLGRNRERGFNQTERLADEMEKLDGRKNFSVICAVKRVRETKVQTSIKNRAEREKNLRDAFEVIDSSLVTGKTLIILDDVTTTGSTVQEIRKVLLAAGAKKVTGLTLAH
ncbi:MAG: hypothetical protein A2664_02015 [Candidatus Taylorbacteria bacterium RIFCSPHIGHO2_01_FULL_46_22b]|uniref:Phosphoribosyltransferase domain-containing protein n=1 Tax=Candidatus Taylorbacteria bacterium RIFCSPHIGHO2_01_FULL_46_22b TaxID=1802301 RepID=A0A1G2M330_9BACT|nr:MAG: hypothetical protein A2664_02015 [Candidatus Taylorbacteria bacterium RIFCSPHIGHO2_01_FULL_46_22b]